MESVTHTTSMLKEMLCMLGNLSIIFLLGLFIFIFMILLIQIDLALLLRQMFYE